MYKRLFIKNKIGDIQLVVITQAECIRHNERECGDNETLWCPGLNSTTSSMRNIFLKKKA